MVRVTEAEIASREFAALDAMIREQHPRPGETRACPDCGRPQHYTGLEYGWAHDALVDTWHCADPPQGRRVMDARDLAREIDDQLMELEDALGGMQYQIDEANLSVKKLREKIEQLDDLLYEAQEASDGRA